MKKRILPLSLVTLVIGLGAFLISATVTFPESFFNDPDNQMTKEQVQGADHYIAKLRNNQHTNSVAPEDVIQAYKQAKALAGNSNKEDFDWSFIGPDNVGGFTKAILYDNTDENYTTIIAGAFTGGLYKSTNSGQTWNKINGVESNLHVSCIAQAADGTIYVGTGGKLLGSGIYKSTDSENFELLASTDPSIGFLAFGEVIELAVNQNNGAIFASTATGIFYSLDEGQTWDLAKTSDDAFLDGMSTDVNIGSNGITAASMNGLCYISEDGDPNGFVLHSSDTFDLPFEGVGGLELAIAPSNPDILYATVLDEDAELINIYVSEDKGVNWRVIAPGNSPTLPLNFDLDNNVLAVFPENTGRILIGGTDLWEGEKFSETGYYNWLQRSSGQLPPQVFPAYVHTWIYKVIFRPGSNNEFLVGHNGGVSRGKTGSPNFEFTELSKTYTTSQTMRVGLSGFERFVIGGWDQAGVQLILGDGATGQEKNAYQIWSFVPPWGGNGGESFLSIIDPEVAIYSEVSDGGGFVRSEDLGFSLATAFAASGMTYYTNMVTPALYWENFNNENSRDSVGFKVNFPIPQGAEIWLASNNRGYPFKYTTDMAYEPGDSIVAKDMVSTKFFWGSSEAIWMTLEALNFSIEPEWFTISNDDVGLEGDVMSMAISADANYLYAGTFEGKLYRISNLALAYDFARADVESPYCIVSTTEIELTDPSTGQANTQTITSIAVDPQNPNNVLVTCGNYGNDTYVYRSENGTSDNALFYSIQGNLPKMPVFSSIIEMSTGMFIIGTEMGVYECQNPAGGDTEWIPSQGISGEVPVFDLEQQIVRQPSVSIPYWDGVDTTYVTWSGVNNYGVIYAATYGRGIFTSNKFQKPVGIISHDPIENTAMKLNIYPNPVNTSTTLEYDLQKAGELIINVYDINGRMMASDRFSQTEGSHTYQLDCNDLPRGMYIVKVQSGKVVNTSKFIVTR